MNKIQINDKIRVGYYNENKYIPTLNLNNGKINNIEDDYTIVNWLNVDNGIIYSSKSHNNDMNQFEIPEGSVQKKAGDNDWIDKDGNHYNDAGDKQ